MEIERKFLIKQLPPLENYTIKHILQAYISIKPVIRIRQSNDHFFLTIKSNGHLMHEEYEMRITEAEFLALLKKVEGNIIEKKRYLIPLDNNLIAELDVFSGDLAPLTTVEVEFSSLEAANTFVPPTWFGEDISLDYRYKNNNLALKGLPQNN